jgi:hypothetical protein
LNPLPKPGFTPLHINSWTNTSINFTLPIVDPGQYQLTVQTESNGSSQPVSVQIVAPALQGWVDLHTHPLANLGFGGKLFFGWVDADPNGASADGQTGGACAPLPSTVNSVNLALGQEGWVFGAAFPASLPPLNLPVFYCGDTIREQVVHVTEQQNNAYEPNDNTYGSSGYPNFNTWPVWNDIMRQKMWVDWLRRSFNGGLRVMVALAVNNKTLADMTAGPGDLATDDVSSGDLQINQIKAFVARHSDFMELARSSSDVLKIVSVDKKLAVVIGIELDNIGNVGVATSANRIVQGTGPGNGQDVGANNAAPGATGCGLLETGSSASLVAEVDRLYSEDVRYIFPIHLVDNATGGTAVYEDAFDTANVYEEGHAWNLQCSATGDGIGHVYNPSSPSFLEGTAEIAKLGFTVMVPPGISCPNNLGNVNACGLTQAGQIAIREMMRLGMLIDIDHMSEASAAQTIVLAQSQNHAGWGGYPLNSGHNALRNNPLSPPGSGTERSLNAAAYQAIGMLHGMPGIGSVNTDACAWLNAYDGTVFAMGDAPWNHIVGGFGTDWALAMGMPPRLGVYETPSGYTSCLNSCEIPLRAGACSTDSGGPNGVQCQKAKEQCSLTCGAKFPQKYVPPVCNGKSASATVPIVQYNSPFQPSGAAFSVSALGNQTWDYNSVGVAHYGMLPDFLQDVSTLQGLTLTQAVSLPGSTVGSFIGKFPDGSAVVSQMNSGAQYFYQTWRIAEAVAASLNVPPPGITCPHGQTVKLCGSPAKQICVVNGQGCPQPPPTCPPGTVQRNCGRGLVCMNPNASCQ